MKTIYIQLIMILVFITGNVHAGKIKIIESQSKTKLVSVSDHPKDKISKGKAEIVKYKGDPQPELNVSIKKLKSMKGQIVAIYVDGQLQGSLVLDLFGGTFGTKTVKKGAEVPKVRPGSVIEIRSDSKILLKGTLE